MTNIQKGDLTAIADRINDRIRLLETNLNRTLKGIFIEIRDSQDSSLFDGESAEEFDRILNKRRTTGDIQL